MSETTLFIGNKRYSSWSQRGWLACRMAELDFQEVTIPLDTPDSQKRIRAISPSGRVPCLHHGGRAIWDSLSIAEYCAEMKRGLWPEDPAARAQARTIACEMHSGFVELRKAMFFNIGRRIPGQGRTPGALQDIARIEEIWAGTRSRFAGPGPFLFGDAFTLADAFYAPIACRFVTWAPELSPASRAYVDAVWNHPLVAEWVEGGLAETWRSAKYEEPSS